MLDEHFGINVVEFMVRSLVKYICWMTKTSLILAQAAGVIPVVHASAGPYMDIAVPFKNKPTGRRL